MEKQTYRKFRKAALSYASFTMAAIALTACAKGFKLVVKSSTGSSAQIITQTTPDNYVAPKIGLNLSYSSSQSIINFVSNHDSTAQTILNDPAFMGPPYIAGKFDLMLLNLDTNQSQSGAKSQIRFQAVISAAKKVELRLESTDAHMTLTMPGGVPTLHGYWLINNGPIVASMGIYAVVTRNFVSTSNPYTLDGTISAVLGDDYETLGNFSVPLCTVVIDSPWLNDPANNCGNGFEL